MWPVSKGYHSLAKDYHTAALPYFVKYVLGMCPDVFLIVIISDFISSKKTVTVPV